MAGPKKSGELRELDIGEDMTIAIRENDDGTNDIIFHFKNPEEEKKLEVEARKLNLTLEGYAKLLMYSGIDRKGVMNIFNEHGLKTKVDQHGSQGAR